MIDRKRLTAFFALLAMYNMTSNFAHPVTPTLIVERHLDSSMFGVAMAAMTTTYFLFAPFWGKLCGYVPTKRIVLICLFGHAAAQAIFGSSYSEIQVIVGRALAGIFGSGVYTAILNYVCNVSGDPAAKGRNLTVMVTVQNVASAVGFFIGGLLGLISLRASFTAQVVLIILVGVGLYSVCLDDTPFKVRPDEPLTARAVNPFSAFLSARSFMTPMLGLIFIIVAVAGVGQTAFDQCFNYYIKDQFGLSSAYNGVFKGVIAALTLLTNTTVSLRLVSKTDVNRTFLPVMAAAAASLGVVLLWNTLPAFVIIYVLFSVLNALRMPLLQNMCSMRTSPDNSNAVMGFYQSMSSLGGIFGALFAGLIYDLNVMLPFILAFIAFAAAFMISAVYVKKYTKERGA